MLGTGRRERSTWHTRTRTWLDGWRAVDPRDGGGRRGTGLEALAHGSQAAALIDAMPDEELAGGLEALADLCGAEYQLQRFVDAEAHARRGLALARATGRGDLFPGMSQVLLGGLFSTGRLADATELNDGMVEARA